MRALCTEGMAHRDHTEGCTMLVALSAGGPCTQLLAGLSGSYPQPPAPLSLRGADLCSSPAPATSCVPAYCQLLAEPTQRISHKLPPSRSSSLYGLRAGKCCKSCGTDAPVWHPLISCNSSVFQFVPGTAPIIPAAVEEQPSASVTSQCTRSVGKPCAGSHARSGHPEVGQDAAAQNCNCLPRAEANPGLVYCSLHRSVSQTSTVRLPCIT